MQYAMYFHCQTNLVEMFRSLFPNDFAFDGNRAILFPRDKVPTKQLSECIAAALTYHLNKKPDSAMNVLVTGVSGVTRQLSWVALDAGPC